jgi:hypothetical protein
MNKVALLGAAALAASALVGPLKAQPVISDPGYCAQFYPNANCQNLGPGNPYTGSRTAGDWGENYGTMAMGHRHHVRHEYRHH